MAVVVIVSGLATRVREEDDLTGVEVSTGPTDSMSMARYSLGSGGPRTGVLPGLVAPNKNTF